MRRRPRRNDVGHAEHRNSARAAHGGVVIDRHAQDVRQTIILRAGQRGAALAIARVPLAAGARAAFRRVTLGEWPALKPTLPFGQMPIYEEGERSIPTRTGVAANQLVIDSPDAAMMAGVRSGPDVLDASFPR